MRRGFLNTPRSRPGPGASQQRKPSDTLPHRLPDSGDKADATNDAVDVSSAGTVKARSAKGEETPVSRDGANASTTAKPPTKDADPKGKGKAKAVDADDDRMGGTSANGDSYVWLTRFPPQPAGMGRHPDEEFLHTVPRSHGGPHRRRAIFRMWPRCPNGKPIMPTAEPRGTLSPDGYPWGATLYDFYSVNRFPGFSLALLYMTGSALLQAMKTLNELDAAAPEIEWAESEGTPREEAVADTEELIECIERRIHLTVELNGGNDAEKEKAKEETPGKADEKGAAQQGPEKNGDDSEDKDGEDYDEEYDEFDDMEVDPAASISSPPVIPVNSPFHPTHYPQPWPIAPFEKVASVLLQERIPLYLLPQTLYVHDPFSLLSARERKFRNTSWNSRPDIIQTYKLKLSASVRKDSEEARQKAVELEEFKARTLIVMRYKRTEEQVKNLDPVIEVPLPPYPRRMTITEESHLYLSPVAKVGQGHHSIVYEGEWELPRDLFARPKICIQCFKESADKEIRRLKATGRWAKMLRAAGWGPTGRTGHQPVQAELNEVNDPTNLERDGEIIERELICAVLPDAHPSQILEVIDKRNVWAMFMKEKNGMNTAILDFAESSNSPDASVPVIRIDPPFSYESQKTCTHKLNMAIPRTAKFTVVAKLSLEDDPHLVREARTYQQFPERFFRNYDGYTLISQVHAVVPVHAIVPQFYGYYVPQDDTRETPYLSPILLLEQCGEPVDPEQLSLEDQEECASMVLRFQRAGWLHESLAPRNFLVQKGKPTDFPLRRQVYPELSFRLIDFGRSCKFEKAEEKQAEERQAVTMFKELSGRMGITLTI